VAKILVVTWDGGGNVAPALGIARGLAMRGHDVRVLGHRSIHKRSGEGAWRFRSFTHTADLDSSISFSSDEDEFAFLVYELMMSHNVARDVVDELRREPVDVAVVDAMLLGALSAAEAEHVPTVALFSTAFSMFRAGPFVDALAPATDSLNATRSDLGVPRVDGLGEIHDSCSVCVVASLAEFEPMDAFPSHVRFIGPLVDGPASPVRHPNEPSHQNSEPLVLVSFSTSGQRQHEPLQRVVDALGELPMHVLVTTGAAVDPGSIRAPSNTDVVDFVPHHRVMPNASLVVTHAGMGTTMTAITYGVPLVCMPMGRDQFFNAARVEALGAGVTIRTDADLSAIRATVRTALDDHGLRSNARHLAEIAATYHGASDAVTIVESLVRC
jgi:MGT family glycosyltransferase